MSWITILKSRPADTSGASAWWSMSAQPLHDWQAGQSESTTRHVESPQPRRMRWQKLFYVIIFCCGTGWVE
ncbi:MAG: hypothetical protein M3Q13_08175, partial [Pseudomonadota bacterium]|nr:hypothetical protein [Pseudomonadota bacterium]